MSDITPIRPEGEFSPNDETSAYENTDPLENLLDEESDEDFGYVVTRDRATGPDGHPVKLAEWSAQDFASIYTRFRPHLERHARRFLSNPSQIDEVVQDAFLYLMVSLPELDSEIGVLRFLQWKTRLLCLDVMRASGNAYVSSIDDVAEPVSLDPEVSSYLEQQDDAAVLRLALSKLTPRHREVLLASIYEEKSTDQIAAQVGLSENATRQLIFRARSAFKKALLGDDVNTSGMSAAAILSVAARKAASEAKKVGAQAMVFVLFLMLAVGAFVNFTGRGTQTQQVAESGSETQAPATSNETSAPIASPNASESASSGEVVQIPVIPTPAPANTAKPAPATPVKPALPLTNVAATAPSPSPSTNPVSAKALSNIFMSSPEVAFVSKSNVNLTADTRQDYMVAASQGAFADFSFDADADSPFQNVMFTLTLDGKQFKVYASKAETVVGVDKQGMQYFVFYSAMKYLVDSKGKVWDQAELAKGTMRLELVVDNSKRTVVDSVLTIMPTEK